MDEYINKKGVLKKLSEYWNMVCNKYPLIWDGGRVVYDACKGIVKDLPAADVVEVVRCRECRHAVPDDLYGNYWCNRTVCVSKVNADDFCKWGKRKESEESGTDEN